jgi:hypothetical protein
MKKQKKDFRTKIKEEKEKMNQTLMEEKKVQPDVPELIVEDFSNNPDYKFCVGCNTWKPKTEYFVAKNKSRNTITLFKRCKWCHNTNNREKAKQYWEDRRKNYGGSEHIYTKPNTYVDEYQKEQTFWLMQLLGWTYNEIEGIWTKEGIKELRDEKIFWVNVKPKIKPPKKEPKKKLPNGYRKDVDVEKIIKLKNLGWSHTMIANELGCSIPTVRDRIKNY